MNSHSQITWRFLLLAILLWIAPSAFALEVRTIGIIADGPGFDREALIQEVTELAAGDFDIRFPEDKIRFGSWNPVRIDEELDALLADPDVDLVIALGVIASHQATRRVRFDKPVVAPFIIDAGMQRVPQKNGASGRQNLTYLSYPSSFDRDLRAFHDIVPFKRVAVVVHAPFLNAMSELPPIPAAAELGFTTEIVPVDGHPQSALAMLPNDIDAVYLTPLPAVPPEAIRQFAEKLVEAKLPCFSLNGQSEVELGLLAGLNDSNQLHRLTRRTAIVIQEILLGADPATMPVLMDTSPPRLSVNVATAEALGLSLPPELQYTATLVGSTGSGTAELGLREAVAEALGANRALAATRERVGALDADRGRAAAAWLPSVEAHGRGQILDPDQVEASLGTQSEGTLVAGLTAKQLLFSDAAVANALAQHDLRDGRTAEVDGAEVELVHQVSVAWTLVQRAAARLAVHLNDVRAVERHLEVARSRKAVGQATNAEVARWEAEVANARRLVVDARTSQTRVRIGLNLALGRPLGDPIQPALVDPTKLPSGLDDQDLGLVLSRDEVVMTRIEALFVDTAVTASPEVRALDAMVAGQERRLGVARRASLLPTVGVAATVDRVYRSDVARLVLPIPGIPKNTFPAQPDLVWSVGAEATLPLFQGGAHDADRREASGNLAALEQQRSWAESLVEQQVLSSLAAAWGSKESLRLANEAADAAQRSLDWATQAYAEGLATQVQLLEARNASLNAKLAATDASFVLLTDLQELERAVHRQYASLAPAAWDEFLVAIRAAAGGD